MTETRLCGLSDGRFIVQEAWEGGWREVPALAIPAFEPVETETQIAEAVAVRTKRPYTRRKP